MLGTNSGEMGACTAEFLCREFWRIANKFVMQGMQLHTDDIVERISIYACNGKDRWNS